MGQVFATLPLVLCPSAQMAVFKMAAAASRIQVVWTLVHSRSQTQQCFVYAYLYIQCYFSDYSIQNWKFLISRMQIDRGFFCSSLTTTSDQVM